MAASILATQSLHTHKPCTINVSKGHSFSSYWWCHHLESHHMLDSCEAIVWARTSLTNVIAGWEPASGKCPDVETTSPFILQQTSLIWLLCLKQKGHSSKWIALNWVFESLCGSLPFKYFFLKRLCDHLLCKICLILILLSHGNVALQDLDLCLC